MVFVQHRGGVREIQLVVAPLVPRELGHPFQIRANDLRFHGFASRAFQSTELTLDFDPRLLGEFELVELLAEFGDFFVLVVVAELLLNGFDLLAQEHLALTFAEFFLHLRLDLLLRFEQGDLTLYVHEHAAEALFNGECFEQPLLFGDGEFDVSGHQVGKLPRLGDGIEDLMHDLFGKSAALAQFSGAFADFLMEGLEGGILVVEGGHLLGVHHDGRQEPVALRELEGGGALFTLEEELHTAESALDLPNARDHTHRVQDVGGGFFGVITLRHGKDEAIPLEGCLDGAQCARTPRRDGRGESGKDDRPAEREDGQGLASAHLKDFSFVPKPADGGRVMDWTRECDISMQTLSHTDLRHNGTVCNFRMPS